MELNQSLRDRLAELDAQIAILEAERKIIHKKLKSITYPVLKLPFEVTGEIFVHCLPHLQDVDQMFDFSPVKLPIPVLLTQVCRAWRNIAFKTPKIWAVFSLQVDDVGGQDHSTWRSRRLTEWLERERTAPLSCTLEQYDTAGLSGGALPTLLVPILTRANQWQNVDLRLPREYLVTEQFRSNLHGRLHSLETVRITLRPRSEMMGVVTAFEIAPILRRVFLEYLPARKLLLPWRQLTHFGAQWMDGRDCLHVLQSADSLVECKFDWVQGDMEPETTLLSKNVVLKVLHLRGGCVWDVLSVLTLPSLVELDYDDGGYHHEHFIDFLSRSSPPLSRLTLYNRTYSRISHHFSFLLDLTVLEISRITSDILSAFSRDLRTRDPASFLPNLESIACSGYQTLPYCYTPPKDTFDVNYEELTDALEFRRNRNIDIPGPRLQSFRMKWTHEERMHDTRVREYDYHANALVLIPCADFRANFPRLQDLMEDGMHISVIAEVGDKSAVWI